MNAKNVFEIVLALGKNEQFLLLKMLKKHIETNGEVENKESITENEIDNYLLKYVFNIRI